MIWALGFWEFLDKHATGLGFLVVIVAMIIAATVASMYESGGEE